MLKIDVRVGETIKVGDALIRVAEKSGQLASLVIDAPKSVKIERKEPKEPEGGTKVLSLQA